MLLFCTENWKLGHMGQCQSSKAQYQQNQQPCGGLLLYAFSVQPGSTGYLHISMHISLHLFFWIMVLNDGQNTVFASHYDVRVKFDFLDIKCWHHHSSSSTTSSFYPIINLCEILSLLAYEILAYVKTSALWPPNYNQFWVMVDICAKQLKKFHQGIPEILCSQEWDRRMYVWG